MRAMTSRRALCMLLLLPAAACSPAQPATCAPAPGRGSGPGPGSASLSAPVALPAAAALRADAAELVIRRLLEEQSNAWNRHDADAWVTPFSEDAEFVNILGTLLEGRAEIARRHAEIFKSIFARSRVVVSVRRLRILGESAAIAETDYELRDYDRLPPGIQPTDADGTLRTRLKYVFERSPAGWRIVAAQNTAVLPARAPAPSEAKP